ncbi:MAG TPA: chemotaxis protein CheR [Verrucomicrobia bacterium]|nr:MAG: chemotaxis protein CheR [Lentisphaerae bacterium GWF2_57_35]HBA84079.1 chemotaxis protein CheR [Verrucomicrobiota bacterium]
MTEPGTLDKKTFHKFAQLIYEKCGITLGEKKEALVQARVGKRMRALGLTDFEAYFQQVEKDDSGEEVTALLDAISTNVTHFFREPRHFELLGQLVKEWEAKGQTRFRVWCAASSTGEEPYSLAITLNEHLSDARDAKILATDISTRVLEKARQGVYEERHMESVPRTYQTKYFRKELHAEPVRYRVDPSLQKMVTFGRVNLSTPPFPLKGPLDVVFCRNVMIYFDNKVRSRLLDNFFSLLRPKGYLMVGHAESLSGMLSQFKSVEPSVYIKP